MRFNRLWSATPTSHHTLVDTELGTKMPADDTPAIKTKNSQIKFFISVLRWLDLSPFILQTGRLREGGSNNPSLATVYTRQGWKGILKRFLKEIFFSHAGTMAAPKQQYQGFIAQLKVPFCSFLMATHRSVPTKCSSSTSAKVTGVQAIFPFRIRCRQPEKVVQTSPWASQNSVCDIPLF